jgi:hypothetical protein
MDEVACEHAPHLRVGFVRAVAKAWPGAWRLECGHYTRESNIVHCQECGATLVRCPVCASVDGPSLSGREYLTKGGEDGGTDV